MTNARIFLDLYNTLEELLKAKYTTPDRHYSNVILRYVNEAEGRRWREELDICREIRNMLSHHSRYDGEDIIQPADSLIELLREVIDTVENPPVAMTICTPVKNLLFCREDERTADLVRKMRNAGYSHVPILRDRALYGVFNSGVLFSRLEKYGNASVDGSSLVSEFDEFLPVEAHTTESYRFVAPDASYFELKSLFDPEGPHKPRIAALFVTRNGKKNGELLGMITPWDMLRCFPE